jgi:hypothetical protein
LSDSPHRSFERITRDDLARLARLALADLDDLFNRKPHLRTHAGQLRLICLIQSAAKHYVDPDRLVEPEQRWGGVNDFDLCAFFEAVPGHPFPSRRTGKQDFGSSKFGRDPTENERFKGRRVDVFGRSISMPASETSIEAVQRYLRDAPPKSSAKYWAAKPVIVLWPSNEFDRNIWTPRPLPCD